MKPLTLVVQVYIKTDTLKALCDSLLNCNEMSHIRLVFWADSPLGARNSAVAAPLQLELIEFLNDFIRVNFSFFSSIELFRNGTNLGPCKTCEVALNYVFESDEFAVIVEDDVVFAKDAFLWFDQARNFDLFKDDHCWAIAGESIYFDSRNKEVLNDDFERGIAIIEELSLVSKFVTLNFIPSTCFATTSQKWADFGATRGLPRGDAEVCTRCRAENKYAIFPVVPRVKDTGMIHDLGFSVMLHSKEVAVNHNKQTYILSDQVIHNALLTESFSRFDGDTGALFRRTTLLEKS